MNATNTSRSRTTTRQTFVAVLALFVPIVPCAVADDPKDILATFELHPDFQLEVAAMEPAVLDPVDLVFDELGRPFVIEMPGYPFPDPANPGKLVLLEDRDGDGLHETRKVYADGFALADSLMPFEGGFLVASPPEILFLKDTDGDDVADVRQIVFSGIAVENPQHNVNGLTYAIDNWIYAANGGNSGTIAVPAAATFAMRFDDFRIDHELKRIERAGRSTGGFEIAFDNWGRMFGTHNLYPMSHLVFPGPWIDGLPQPRTGTLHQLPDDVENGLVRIYPIGEQETRVNHPEQSGYFSGSCGITHYGGGAFGPEFDGNLFVCDVVLNLVHRRILEPDGTSFVARRDDRPKAEFLASTDRAFRPVNMAVAPDGSLWVVDMHRDVIEHPEWIPDEIEQGVDLDAGKDMGRLFRISPKSGLPRVTPNFQRDEIETVVAALEHPNQWCRLTAQRLLVEWDDDRAVPALQKLARDSAVPVARAHAMWTLDALDALDVETLLAAFRSDSNELIEHAIRLAIPRINRSAEVADVVARIYTRPNARMRMWAALAYSQYREPQFDATPQLLTILGEHGADPMMRLALLPGLLQDADDALSALLTGDRPSDGGNEMLALLAEASVSRLPLKEAQRLLDVTASTAQKDPPAAQAFLAGFSAGLTSTKSAFDSKSERDALAQSVSPLLQVESTPLLREVWSVARALELKSVPRQDEALRRARAVVEDASAKSGDRVDNLRIVEFAPFDDRADLLYTLLDTRQPRELQREAIQQLQREDSQEIALRLIAMWRTLGPETRPTAGDILLYKRPNNDLLLDALEAGKISLGEMDFHLERRRVLLRSRNPNVVRRAEALFTDAGVVTRKEAMAAMQPALSLVGNVARGEFVFSELCLRCHRMRDDGGDLGPNLTEVYRKSRETLLHDILDPNAAVVTAYVSYTIERNNGEIVSGLIAEETDGSVAIRDANGVRTVVERSDIREMISDGLSLMPEELESGLDAQAMADLLAYLQERK